MRESIYIHNALLKKYMPKLLAKFEQEGIIAESYCTQWYMTMFAISFPVEIVVRIWDVLFIEGRKTVFRIALAILKINEKKLMESDISETLTTLKEYKDKCNLEQLF